MALFDLLGRRWALRIVWELRDGPLTFRALQEQGGVSPTVLNARLANLRGAGIVEQRAGEGYALSAEGARLLAALAPLQDWATRWAKRGGG